jgi:RNA polymerase sigma factor (sigma-70 family)
MPGRWIEAGRANAFSARPGQEAMPVRFSDHDPRSAHDPGRAQRFRDAALPYLDDAYTLARYLPRDANDAEDAVQECFLRALKHFDSYRGPAIKPWLFAILRNVCHAEFTRRASSPAATDDLPDDAGQTPLWGEAQETPEAQLLRQRDATAIRRLVIALEEPFRETSCCAKFIIFPIAKSPTSSRRPSAP